MLDAPNLPVVSRFEADLLAILQGCLGHLPRAQLFALLRRTSEAPRCLSRTCVNLVKDTLAKGVTLTLAHQGWRQERFMRGDIAVTGRLWERTPPAQMGLLFSPASLSFLRWATASDASQRGEGWTSPGPLTLGDSWFLTMAYAAVQDSGIGTLWRERRPWRNDALCRLHYASDFDTPATPDFTALLTPSGISILEASQYVLAQRWLAMEQAKVQLATVQQLRAAALGQSRVLTAYLAAIDRVGRRDLARFLLIAGTRLFAQPARLRSFTGDAALANVRLAERQQAQRDVLVVAEHFETLARWQADARRIGYFDEGYQAAQLWKVDWEAYKGESALAAARQHLAQAQQL